MHTKRNRHLKAQILDKRDSHARGSEGEATKAESMNSEFKSEAKKISDQRIKSKVTFFLSES